MTNSDGVRWGIVGGGNVVQRTGLGFSIPGKSRVVAVCRRELDDAKRTASMLRAHRSVTDVTDLVSDPEVNAVYIATPPGLHFAAAQVCADFGKSAYIEKPFVTSSRDAEALVEMFATKGLGLYVAHYYRALPKFKTLRQIMESQIGTVSSFHYSLSRRLVDNIGHPWLFDPVLSGGGKFADIAPHSIDLLTYFFGNAVDVWAAARHVKAPNGREDVALLGVRFETGVCGTLNYNFLASRKTDRLTVVGTEATLEFSVHADLESAILYQDGRRDVIDVAMPQTAEATMIGEVVDALLGEGGHPCTGKAAIETVRIMEIALRSLY